MPFHVATNRAGDVCVVDEHGTHDAQPSYFVASQECLRLNALEARAQRRSAALEDAGFRLAELAGAK